MFNSENWEKPPRIKGTARLRRILTISSQAQDFFTPKLWDTVPQVLLE